ncbi:MAG: c-type cytochrome [Pirellulales bacterium]|nr:c-type cytochrome [Pirellulales bacterium]
MLVTGCSDQKPKPASNAATDVKATTDETAAADKNTLNSDKSTAGERSAPGASGDIAAKTDPSVKVVLGADELLAGIPGSPELTVEEIQAWLDNPANHETLDYELPLGMSAGKGQEKGLVENPLTRAKIELGRELYFDPRLSADGKISCASCHAPDHGFARETQFGVGVGGQQGNRNSPVAYNRLLSDLQFWDGRAASLEEQAKGPIANPIEMANTHEACVATIKSIPGYELQFQKIFASGGHPGEVTIDNVAKAIASFERALVTGPSPFDYYDAFKKYKDLDPDEMDAATKAKYDTIKAGMEAHPMSENAIRGMQLFFGKANCSLCHVGPNLTDEKYHNLGVGMDRDKPDLGRYEVTKDEKDWGAFKTPTIRNVEFSAPYMHDGSQKTLEEVVEWYNKGGHPNKNLDEKIKPLNLTDQEQADLIAFMKACSGSLPKVNESRKPK